MSYFSQELTAKRSGTLTEIALTAATGTYRVQDPNYLLRVHQAGASVTSEGTALEKFPSESAFRSSGEPGWYSGTEVRLPAGVKASTVKVNTR